MAIIPPGCEAVFDRWRATTIRRWRCAYRRLIAANRWGSDASLRFGRFVVVEDFLHFGGEEFAEAGTELGAEGAELGEALKDLVVEPLDCLFIRVGAVFFQQLLAVI